MSREPVRTPGWSGRLLMFSATIFIIALVVYFGLLYGYMPYAEKQRSSWQDKKANLEQQVSESQRTEILNFYSQLSNLNSLLDGHVLASSLFDLFEKNTVKSVYFTKLSFSGQDGQIMLTGVGKTMDDITSQMRVFQGSPEVKKITLSGASVIQGGVWQFDMNLYLSADALKAGGSGT